MERRSEGLRFEVGSSCQVVGKAWGLERIWEVLGGSWSGPGLLLGILVGFLEALGLSWAAPGLHLGRLGHSWAALGRSWKLLGSSWALLGGSWALLGVSWAFLGCSGALLDAKLEPSWAPRGTKSTPRASKIEAKTVQDALDM